MRGGCGLLVADRRAETTGKAETTGGRESLEKWLGRWRRVDPSEVWGSFGL